MKSSGRVAIIIAALTMTTGIIALNFTTGFQGWRDSTLAKWGGANGDCDGSEVLAHFHEVDGLFAKYASGAEAVKHQVSKSELPGRVDLHVTVERNPERSGTDAVVVYGTYGDENPRTARNFIDDEEKELVPGECAIWKETLTTIEDDWTRYVYTVRGAWGEHPYCFSALIHPPEDAGGWSAVRPSEPYCFVAHWESDWGVMKSPPTPAPSGE